MAKAEKICGRTGGSAWRKFAKNRTNRIRRRAAKIDPENAPRRLRDVIRGWSD